MALLWGMNDIFLCVCSPLIGLFYEKAINKLPWQTETCFGYSGRVMSINVGHVKAKVVSVALVKFDDDEDNFGEDTLRISPKLKTSPSSR
jgi:hypothetical protein